MSQVSYKGLYQGSTQTSLYPQIIYFTTHFTTSDAFFVFFFNSLFIFCGHSTWETASSRVTYFILRAYTGTGVSHSRHRKKWDRFGKMQVNGPEGQK